MPAAWLPTDWLWTPCGGHHLVGEGPESFAQMIVIKTKPSVSVSIKDGAAGTGTTIMYHQQAPAPSTSALHQGQALELSHHQAPTPSTSDKHQHESPAQGTFSRHQHEAPARDTNTLHQQQAPASSTSTKHQDPRGWVAPVRGWVAHPREDTQSINCKKQAQEATEPRVFGCGWAAHPRVFGCGWAAHPHE